MDKTLSIIIPCYNVEKYIPSFIINFFSKLFNVSDKLVSIFFLSMISGFEKLKISQKNLIIFGVIAIAFIGGVILFTNGSKKSKGLFYDPDANVKIVKSEASKIELEDYQTNEFSIKIPKGWKVDTLGDYIHYTIKVYNPDKPLYQFFLNMKTEGYNKSEDAKRWQQKYYPNDMFAKTSVIATKDTEGCYKIFND